MRESDADDLIAGHAWNPTDSGCWIWTGPTNRRGQPIVSVDGEGALVHRVAYRCRLKGQRLHGDLRPNVPLVPTCGDHRCVNPAHLEPVNPKKQALDPRGRVNRSKDSCPQGHAYSGSNLRVRSSGRRRCLACHRDELRRYRERKWAEAERLRQAHQEAFPDFWLEPSGPAIDVEPAEYRVVRIA